MSTLSASVRAFSRSSFLLKGASLFAIALHLKLFDPSVEINAKVSLLERGCELRLANVETRLDANRLLPLLDLTERAHAHDEVTPVREGHTAWLVERVLKRRGVRHLP